MGGAAAYVCVADARASVVSCCSKRILSGVINFTKFRSERLTRHEKLVSESEALLEQRQQVRGVRARDA